MTKIETTVNRQVAYAPASQADHHFGLWTAFLPAAFFLVGVVFQVGNQMMMRYVSPETNETEATKTIFLLTFERNAAVALLISIFQIWGGSQILKGKRNGLLLTLMACSFAA